MIDPAIGSLFSGYGGLDMAVRAALGCGHVVWHSDIKPASVALLRHRHPDVPNLGDLTRAWPAIGPITREAAALDPIDVLAASWPCQPHSSAGKRLGEADPRALWPNVARAIAETRPALFFGENVARITSNGELRRVVRSLADLGYVGAWRVQLASDVYAPHRRARCFVVAVDAAAYTSGSGLPEHSECNRPPVSGEDGARGGDALRRRVRRQDHLTLLPTPTQSMTTGAGTSGRDGGLNLQTAVTLLPTPKASDGYKGGPGMRGSSGDLALPSVAVTLLPTPTAQNYGTNQGGAAGRTGAVRESLDTMARNDRLVEWGAYAEAVARWDAVLGRTPPAPTQPSLRNGKPQLNAPFVEWMMGLPQGWVSDVPVLAWSRSGKPNHAGHRNAALSLLGDGVVPQQGAAAFRFLLNHLAQRFARAVAA